MDNSTNVKKNEYDDLGRMTKVDNGLTTLGEYTFNPDNSRRSKTEGGTTTNFFYDFEDIIGEYNSDTINSQFTYTGREYSSATDNYYYRARTYNAGIGRFLSRDAFPYDLLTTSSIHRYNYCMNSPVNYTDPLGLIPPWILWGLLIARDVFVGYGGYNIGCAVGSLPSSEEENQQQTTQTLMMSSADDGGYGGEDTDGDGDPDITDPDDDNDGTPDEDDPKPKDPSVKMPMSFDNSFNEFFNNSENTRFSI